MTFWSVSDGYENPIGSRRKELERAECSQIRAKNESSERFDFGCVWRVFPKAMWSIIQWSKRGMFDMGKNIVEERNDWLEDLEAQYRFRCPKISPFAISLYVLDKTLLPLTAKYSNYHTFPSKAFNKSIPKLAPHNHEPYIREGTSRKMKSSQKKQTQK